MNSFLKNRPKVGIIIFLVLLGGVLIWFVRNSSTPLKNSRRLGTVTKETLIQRVTIAGNVEAIRTTVVNAPYDGYIKKLFVKLGQKVQAGDPLVSVVQSLQENESVFPIRSPFSGTVTQLLRNEGQYVKPGDTKDSILRIDDLTKMLVTANAPEIDVIKIKTNLEATIKVSAIQSRNYRGIVRDISQAATLKDQWGGRSQVDYLVKLEITDSDDQVKPGMSGVVDIIINKKENALSLGHEFIQREKDSNQGVERFFVILADGTKKNIKLGLQNETAFEILEGLTEGQEVQQVDFLKLIESDK